jgi:hypothetical protein
MTHFSPLRRAAFVLVACTSFVGAAAHAQDGWWGSGERVEGSGKRGTDNRSLSEFNNLNVSGSWTVQLRQGNNHSVTVEGDDNLLPYIETKVEGKSLTIQPKKGTRLMFKEKAVVTVNFVDMRTISLGGSNNLESPSLRGDRLDFNLGGGGGAKFDNLDVKRFTANIGGSGSVNAKGKAEQQSYNIGGSGSVRASDLEGEKVNVSIGGSGSLRVWAKSHLDVSVAGSGSVAYKGDPKISRSIVGSGTVRKIED